MYGYPMLEAVAEKQEGSREYTTVKRKIEQAIGKLVSNDRKGTESICRLRRIVLRANEMGREVDEEVLTKPRKDRPVDPHPREIHAKAFHVLRSHMCCTCDGSTQGGFSHLARLMLQPVLQNTNDYGQVQFDMLFSSSTKWGEQVNRWQDVELLVSQPPKRQKSSSRPVKSTRFSKSDEDPRRLPRAEDAIEVVGQGDFCSLIKSDTSSRVRLAVQDEKLQRYRPSLLKQMVQHLPGISLANILENYHLSAKMKTALAYILAHSVWQYYDTDWMTTTWTSETIQFIWESKDGFSGHQGLLFPSKPYLCVQFDNEDPSFNEYSTVKDEIHYYPRIRTLGIMLVEIGIGSPLPKQDRERQVQSLAATTNQYLTQAIRCLNDGKLWENFEFPDYRDAVKDCLDPRMFTLYGEAEETQQGLRQRRDMLYKKVVSRLKDLLEGTKWMEQLINNRIDPLNTSFQKSTVQQVKQHASNDGLLGQKDDKKAKKTRAKDDKDEKEAMKWLSRMQKLSGILSAAPGHSTRRVRIAILDTGCDNDSPFFHLPSYSSRLKGWKDYVDGSEEWVDKHGHGTHLVSLIMDIAIDADVYIARVAADATELSTASENVAKVRSFLQQGSSKVLTRLQAIAWASKEWEADIITMSFGYTEEKQCISYAILDALNDHHGSKLFFAAASNSGSNQVEMFPARHDSVISIRATNADGQYESFNPPRSDNDTVTFGTLGLKVPGAWLSDHIGKKCQTGTSVATAIAAATAALLIGYINRIEVGASSEFILQNVKRKIRTYRGMLALFKALSTETLNQHSLYLTPWQLLDKSDDERWIKIAAAVADV
ncbi:peptidase S8/S53 domain-containing protein [Trichoderma sp. SZMC 28014]